MSHNSPNPDSPGKSSNKLPVPAKQSLFRPFKGLREKDRSQAEGSVKLLPHEEPAQIEQRARAIWKARKDDSKITAEDDWYEAIAQLKREHSFPGKRFRDAGSSIRKTLGLEGKTPWDLFQALVVPTTLVVIGFALQEFADQRDSAQQALRRQQEQALADDKARQDTFQQEVRRQQEQALADDKARQDTLVRYLAEMSDLLEKGLLRSSSGSERVIIAQAKTIIALQSLDAKRQNVLIQFLEASNLNTLNQYGLLHRAQMAKSDFRGSDLSGAVMIGADLEGAKFGCLFPDKAEESERQCSSLRGANLNNSNLAKADFSHADLAETDFSYANLTDADFSHADLAETDFSYANLTSSSFRGAVPDNLDGAILLGTYFPDDELSKIFVGLSLSFLGNLTFVCAINIPDGTAAIDPDRDCDRLPVELMKRYPNDFPTLDDAEQFVRTFTTFQGIQ